MLALFKAALLTVCISVCAQAQTRTVAVYTDIESSLNPASAKVIQQELQRLVQPVGIDLVWKDVTQRNNPDNGNNFEMIMVGSFDGSCSVSSLPTDDSPMPGALADTSISNGHVLPFFKIDCAHVLRMLTPLLRSRVVPVREAILGRALARVIAHEVYHILARTSGHPDSGIAKSSFSVGDLINDQLMFDSWTIARMRPVTVADLAHTEEPTR